MRALRAAFACCLAAYAGLARASPPLPDDLSLSVRIVSTTDPSFQPGAHAVLSFKIGQHGPIDRAGTILLVYTTTPIPDGSDQPLQLTPVPDSACAFSSLDYQGSWTYTLGQNLPAIDQPIECLVGLDVLDGAAGGFDVTFAVQVMDEENGYDPEPGNDNVTLVVAGVGSPEASPFYRPMVEPGNPTIADDIRWIAQWDGCGSLGPATITHWTDGLIEVRWPSSRVCGVPIGGDASFDVGHLPAGRYTVHVEPCEVGFGELDGPCWPIDSPDDVTFTVVGAAASTVPVLDGWMTFALITLIALLGAVCVRMRPR